MTVLEMTLERKSTVRMLNRAKDRTTRYCRGECFQLAWKIIVVDVAITDEENIDRIALGLRSSQAGP
ncbi:uncharacterized protein METZ01_LOCUS221656 [marine metagenome]|uniref:Uncharacterized protein n=1 Tax=marine metagenome TaxID=408172 RepID=A0A382G1P3_9ZZZZ